MSHQMVADRIESYRHSLELVESDRCDKCIGYGKVRATSRTGLDLRFCQHHGNRYMAELMAQGFSIGEVA